MDRNIGLPVNGVKEKVDRQTTLSTRDARKTWIHTLLEGRKFKREDISEAAGVSRRTVSRWRSADDERAPDDGEVLAIARKLGVELPHGLGVPQAGQGSGLTEAHRHVGYELKDEHGDVTVRISIVMEVGETRRREFSLPNYGAGQGRP